MVHKNQIMNGIFQFIEIGQFAEKDNFVVFYVFNSIIAIFNRYFVSSRSRVSGVVPPESSTFEEGCPNCCCGCATYNDDGVAC